MPSDIFDFWTGCPGDARKHALDAPVFAWAGDMGFNLECLPSNIWGRLKTAPVVLLYLSPGFKAFDLEYATRATSHAIYERRRRGVEPLDSKEDHPLGYAWWTQRTKVFGTPAELRDKLAIFNLGAYHSATFEGDHALAALPSCRAALAWAHDVLFPEARAGKRVVVCMRSAARWGLKPGTRYGEALYAPAMTRGGHMRKQDEHAEVKEGIIRAARAKLGLPVNC